LKEIRKFFTEQEEKQVVDAIKRAERNTSGEIRVHVEAHHESEALDRAAEVFSVLEMHRTEERNGVLFYLATADKKFAILGDEGLNAKVPANFWNDIRDTMQSHFKKGDFLEGLTVGIDKSGMALAEFFPYQKNDENELPDSISTKL